MSTCLAGVQYSTECLSAYYIVVRLLLRKINNSTSPSRSFRPTHDQVIMPLPSYSLKSPRFTHDDFLMPIPLYSLKPPRFTHYHVFMPLASYSLKSPRFAHDHGIRKLLVKAHRQAWVWQDSYHGLTMDDIRQLEFETQCMLQQLYEEVLTCLYSLFYYINC